MKKLSLVLVLFFSLVTLTIGQGISDGSNPHNFSGKAWNSGNELCEPCHTPHNAIAGLKPLWNHEASSITTYDIYSSTTLDASIGQPDGISKLCLSCHDGSVALDNFGGTTTGTNFIASGANIGGGDPHTNLLDDHPISFTYDDNLATTLDGELHAPSSALSGLGGTIATDMLSGGSMECSSCHDAHNNANGSLLIKTNAGSVLCLTCHNK